MLVALAIYLMVGLALAVTWTGAAAMRRLGGLAAFLTVMLAWPLVLLGLIFIMVSVRNY